MANATLSERCQFSKLETPGSGSKFIRAQLDKYDKTSNPEGVINLATAINGIHSDIVKEKVLSQKVEIGFNAYEYYAVFGSPRLQKAMAHYMTRLFKTTKPVQPENIYFKSSGVSVIDTLAHCLADPGDVFMCVTPVFGGISNAFEKRSLVQLWPIPLSSQTPTPFSLTLSDIEASYKKAVEAGKRVRGIILVNPGNPIGYVIRPELQQEILHFCHRRKLHFVSDEVYAMSVHDPGEDFHSVLRLPYLPDPDRTHLVYGLGKDLGLTRLRVGVLHTFNKDLQNNLKELSHFNCVSYPVMEIAANILEDKEWCDSVFYKSRTMLRNNYMSLCHKLENMGVEVHHTPAAIFVWANFKNYCQPLTFETEDRFFSKLLQEAKVAVSPGAEFQFSEPGWCRIVFSFQEDTVQRGIQRLEKFLEKCKQSS